MTDSANKKFFYSGFISVFILTAIASFLNKGFRLEDALIYYRYIENFINGNGLVYNIGEKFNGLTSPFYTVVSLIVSYITREIEITQHILNAIFLAGSGCVLFLIFFKRNQSVPGIIISMLFVSSKYFHIVFGMETNLYILLSLLCIYFYNEKKFLSLSVFSALLFSTRGEGVFLILVLGFFIIFSEDRKLINYKQVLIFLLVASLQYFFNYINYGNLFPDTLSTKILQGQSGLWGTYSFLFNNDFILKAYFNNQPAYIIALVIFGIIGIANHIKEKFCLILFSTVILNTIFYTALKIPNYHWYYSYHILLLYTFVGFGVYDIFVYFNEKFTSRTTFYTVTTLIFLLPLLTHLQIMVLLKSHSPKEEYVAVSEWLDKNTPKNTKVAAVEIGHIGWYSKRYIIDILGLVSPENGKFIGNREFSKWLDIYHPDYIVVHDPSWGHEMSIPPLVEKGIFVEEKSFSISGLKLLKSKDIK